MITVVAPSVEMEGRELLVSCYDGGYIANTDAGVLTGKALEYGARATADGRRAIEGRGGQSEAWIRAFTPRSAGGLTYVIHFNT